jgi:hypothetical protein
MMACHGRKTPLTGLDPNRRQREENGKGENEFIKQEK